MHQQRTTPTGEFQRVASPHCSDGISSCSFDDIFEETTPRETTINRACFRSAIFPLLSMAAIIVGILGAIGTFSNQDQIPRTYEDMPISVAAETLAPKEPKELCHSRGFYLSNSSCKVCPEKPKVFSVFWESHVHCHDFAASPAATYVTHIYWSFASVDLLNGSVANVLQGKEGSIKACIAATRAKCIKNYLSIGGANMRYAFLALNSSYKIANFATSAAQVVQNYGFDGVGIDDVSGNLLAKGNWKEYSASNAIAYLTSLKNELNRLPRSSDEPAYGLTWDEFPTSINSDCNTSFGDYKRCFDDRIAYIVDHVNLILYNSATSVDYEDFLDTVLPTRWNKALNKEKIVLGGCIGPVGSPGGCAYGATPTSTQLLAYAVQGATIYGGIMLWTGSRDFIANEGATILAMGSTGGYMN